MIDSAEYTPDGKFMVLPKRYGQEEEVKVPVALIDELLERGLSAYELKSLLFVRSLTAASNTRKVKVADLVGEDLTGKTVGFYFRNYEDSEWMSTSNVIGIVHDPNHGDYRFVFPEQYETCWNGGCGHQEDDECSIDSMQGYYVSARETVLITEGDSNA